MNTHQSSFIHSVKVPHTYKTSAKILKLIVEKGESLKDLVYTRVRSNIKGVYALITKTLEHNHLITQVLEELNILHENPRLDEWLAKTLVAELLFGKQYLSGESKPVQCILSYQDQIISAAGKEKVLAVNTHTDRKPRYIRVNTLKMTCDEAIKALRYEGWFLISTPSSYEQFLEVIKNLTEEQFVKDFHVKNLLVFPAGTEFFKHSLYLNGTLILQDKASCLPAQLLAPDGQSSTLDMCSAPGMKTTLLSALMRGKGSLYAVEMNARRYADLQKLVNQAGCTNVTTILTDSVQLNDQDMPWCKDVEFILVDPSCSGSGMTERSVLFLEPITPQRTRKLAAFQRLLLFHALTNFPGARRVVYSTCSVLVEENEAVVKSVLHRLPSPCPWNVVCAMPEWQSRGSPDFEFGLNCLTASPRNDLTTGFFIAVFERNLEVPISNMTHTVKQINNFDSSKESDKIDVVLPKRKKKRTSEGESVTDSERMTNKNEDSKIEKKRKKQCNFNEELGNDILPKKSKKRRSLNVDELSNSFVETNCTDSHDQELFANASELNSDPFPNSSKKKHKKKSKRK